MARILIVEDEFLIALVANDALVDAGHTIVGMASTFESGIALARKEQPDLAVLDVRIASARDGIDLALALRAELGIPAVFTTGSRDDANVMRASPAQPAGWLLKPYTEADLLAAVADALDGIDTDPTIPEIKALLGTTDGRRHRPV
ncbi:response regulator [Tabrizicola sp. BL-A-41-H6]|uniref:response regulator n=1 Tax=Tabrizicola sp. BL-A-41-H6 TaxID=3421107 RepID=UPI003D67ECBB